MTEGCGMKLLLLSKSRVVKYIRRFFSRYNLDLFADDFHVAFHPVSNRAFTRLVSVTPEGGGER